MAFIRKVANSDILAGIIDIPESLKNRKVEILIFPYENTNMEYSITQSPKRARGLLERYKNKELQEQEAGAWARAVVLGGKFRKASRRFQNLPKGDSPYLRYQLNELKHLD